MSDLRSKFEEIEKVKEVLVDYANEVVFNELEGKYIAPCYQTFIPEYIYELNFGWHVFQERQKKIDAVLDKIENEWSKRIELRDIEDEIKEILNG